MEHGEVDRPAVPVDLTATLVTDARAIVGEGPVWDHRRGILWWVDIEGRRVHAFDPASAADRTFATDRMVGAVALRAGGGLLLALADRLALVEAGEVDALLADGSATGASPTGAFVAGAPATGSSGAWRTLTTFDDGPLIRCNDGKCDPAGRLIIGRMALDEGPHGTLLSVAADGVSRPLLDGLRIPNGLAWSADGRTMYYIDTPTRRVDAFDYDPATGSLAAQRVHRACDDLDGSPDGMTRDAEGALWVAFWGGSAVRRIAPDGTMDAVVRLPVRQVTSCTFGGPRLEDLYITTAARGVDESMAGGLFRVRPGVRGAVPDVFAG